jgi:hypothetical protein
VKKQLFFSAIIFLGASISLQAQNGFEWGMAEKKLEPSKEQVSLSLAGYGIPAEGRFSISWQPVQDARLQRKVLRKGRLQAKQKKSGDVRSVTSLGKYEYILKEDGTMWYGRPGVPASMKQNGRKNDYTWKEPLTMIVGLQNNLFALSVSGELLKAVHSSDSSLSVSSLVVQKNGKTVVLIGVDVCGLQYAFTQSIKDSLRHRFGIAPEGILINASHTHFAPVTQEWKAWAHYYHTPDSSYLYGVVQGAIISSVEMALQQLSPGGLSFTRGTTDIGANRRPQANPQKPYDASLDIVTLTRGRDELKGLLFLTGCHPVFPNEKETSFTLSANYPGVARKILKAQLGVDNALFVQGCGGDINPVKPDYRGTGADLAEDVLKTLKQRSTTFDGDISFRFDSILVPVQFWSREKILAFREQNQQLGADLYAEKNVRWADIMLNHLENGTAPTYIPIYVQTIAIGNWLLVGLSREVVTEYGINIKAQWPGKLVSVAGYCNDVSSYLPAQWHIRTKVYEGYESSFWYAQPDLFPENILDIVLEKVRSIVP